MTTTVESNKELVRRFTEVVLNQGHFERLGDFYATTDQASHINSDFPALRKAFSNLYMVIEDLFGEGDKIGLRFTLSGTNDGPFMGRPATGKTARWGGVTLISLKDGKMVEEWVYPDRLAVMQQLGIIPSSIPTHASEGAAVPSH